MEHVGFGRTDMSLSRPCLGTMPFGHQCDVDQSIAIVDTAAEQGFTFIDTADVYPPGAALEQRGQTERIIDRWMTERGNRDDRSPPSSLRRWAHSPDNAAAAEST